MATTTFRLVHAAGDMFMPEKRRHAIAVGACHNGDVVTLSEVVNDHEFLHTIAGFLAYVVGELAILWDASKFERVAAGHQQVMQGGRRGPMRVLGRVIPKRLRRARRGPSRLVIWVLLRDKATGELVLIFTHHAIAKADTAHKWRRLLRRTGFVRTANVVIHIGKEYAGVPKILTGDLNTIGRIVAFGRAGLRQIKTPRTFGRLRYDRIFASQGSRVDAVSRFDTAGDHMALKARVTLNWKDTA